MSQRYYTRDDNRRDVLRIIYGALFCGHPCCAPIAPLSSTHVLTPHLSTPRHADLIEEGAKEQGGLDPAAPGAAYINAVLEARRRVSAQLAEGQAAGVEAQ